MDWRSCLQLKTMNESSYQRKQYIRLKASKYSTDRLVEYKDRLPKQFYVCALMRASGKAPKEIANELQIPHNTVKTRIFRAHELIEQFDVEKLLK